MAKIFHVFHINAYPLTVFEAVSTLEGLSGWWTEDTGGSTETGEIVNFRFGDRYYIEMEIVKQEQGKYLEWKCHQGEDEWIGTNLTFEIIPNGENSLVKFTHRNWKEITDFYGVCNYHWGLYMKSIKLFCETGTGTPFKIDD